MALIKKRYTEKKFAALKKRLHSPHHAERLESMYKNVDGSRVLKEELSKEDQKNLAEIKKIVKKNRGLLRLGRLVVIGVPVVAAAVYMLFFMNPMLTRLLERGLESLFQADAEVIGLDFRPFQPGMSIERIIQGDEQRPMTNLFELDNLELSFEFAALMRGSFVISAAQAENISWGGAREVSAALESSSGNEEIEDSEGSGATEGQALPEGDGVDGDPAALIGNLSAESALEEIRSRVDSPELISDFAAEIELAIPQWENRGEEIGGRVTQLAGEYGALLDRDIQSISDPQALTALVSELQSGISQSERLVSDAQSLVQTTRGEYDGYQTSLQEIREEIDNEFSGFLSQVDDLRAGSVSQPLQDLIRNLMVQAFGSKAELMFRGLDFYRRFRETGGEPGALTPRAGTRIPGFRPGGVDVAFPVPEFPRFHIKNGNFSVEDPDGVRQSLQLTNLSNQPELVAEPAVIEYAGVIGVPLTLTAVFDGRVSGVTVADIAASSRAILLEAKDLPAFLGAQSIGGLSDLDFTARLGSDSQSGIESSIVLREVAVNAVEPSPVSRGISTALQEADNLYIDFSSDIDRAEGLTDARVESNIPDLISSAVGRLIQEQIDEYRSELIQGIEGYREELYQSLADSFGPAAEALSFLETELTQAESLEEGIASVQQEAEQRIRAIAQERAQEAQDAVRDAAEGALENLPSLPSAPNLPRLPGRN